MEVFSTTASSIMRSAVGACLTPVIVLLLLAVVLVIVCIGSIIAELISERRHFQVFLPELLEELKIAGNESEIKRIVKNSGLLMRQKQYLNEIASHPDVTSEMRESLAAALEYKEQKRYDNITRITEILSRVAPMLGLLGTLIPLGPGIVALGQGNVDVLASSMLTAFDTTSMGLLIAAFALVITVIRKSWYKDYMVTFDAAIELILEVEKKNNGAGEVA